MLYARSAANAQKSEQGESTVRQNSRAGQMLILVTLSLFFLFSVMGLSVDLGYSYFVKVYAQAAADTAAQAAALYANSSGYVCGTTITCNTTYTCVNPPTSPPTTALQAGCLYAQTNGFVNASPQSVSLIANNTTTPNESTNKPALWIQANVAQNVPHLFLFWAGFQSGSVAAQAIAGVTVTPAASCVYVLDTAATADALYLSGAATLTTTGCGVYVDSSHATKALELAGSAAITSSQILVHGGATIGGGTHTSPAVTTGAATTADPFINVPAPTVPNTCGHNNYSATNGDALTPSISFNGGTTSGVYCGGITVGGVAHITMAAGLYIVNGGGFNVGNSGRVDATGVTIFLTGQNGQTPKPMILNGSGIANLTAPASGTYMGILFYQDRSTTYGTANSIGSSAVLTATGAMYFPTTTLTFSGAVAASTIAVVAKDFTITGSASLAQDTTGTLTGLATRSPGLIQ